MIDSIARIAHEFVSVQPFPTLSYKDKYESHLNKY